MQRFERVLDLLPKGYVFDGDLVVLDDTGRPLFNELLFGRRSRYRVAAMANPLLCKATNVRQL